jgi:hypothetical protein
MKQEKALLVTTAHRGVFFGYGTPSNESTITLTKSKMCVYWTAGLHGVLGLATQGPGSGCKVGPAVTKITLRDVTAVIECTDAAAQNWDKEIWS